MILKALAYSYTATLAGLAVYALHLMVLILLYLRHRGKSSPPTPDLPRESLPEVTVQIPLRNERYVVERILQAVAALDWPAQKLSVQILDDSDDDTTAIAKREARRLRAAGLDVQLYHRSRPQGHKAGALAAGLRKARGAFIALFDADFCPPPDFLRRTVPHLVARPELGMVQARWGHLNAQYSLLTRIQALLLDAHFTVEHLARNRSGLLMNFNGTAGVWRREAIVDAGGWQSDTVAEDLDLSYRAQIRGWQILYLPEVVAPAELPPLVTAFKQQQYRWAKGAAQSLRKLAGPLLRSPHLTGVQKGMALLHLSGYVTQPLFLLMLLLAVPLVLLAPPLPPLTAFLGSVIAVPPLLYLLGQISLYRDWPRRMLSYPVLMLLGMGLAWTNTLAFLDGLLNWGGEFRRTPKYRLRARGGSWKEARYRPPLDGTLWGEVGLALYALLGLWAALRLDHHDLLPVILTFAGGELLMASTSLLQHWAAAPGMEGSRVSSP